MTDLQELKHQIEQLDAEAFDELLRFMETLKEEFEDEILDETVDQDDPVESFREGWRDAVQDNTRPIAELWDALKETEDE